MRIAFIIMLAVMLFTVGCNGSEEASEGITELLRLSEDCGNAEAEMDQCCQSQCADFCKSRSARYAKHGINGPTCYCWCN